MPMLKLDLLLGRRSRNSGKQKRSQLTVCISNPPLNPANNAFNGTIVLQVVLFMDLDVYNIQDNIAIGDTTAVNTTYFWTRFCNDKYHSYQVK
jgi:hypothetical protein